MKRKFYLFLPLVLVVFLVQSCASDKANPAKKNVQYVSGADEVTYLKLGKEIVDSVGGNLKQNLLSAMKEGGPQNAISFCNQNAVALTNSYSLKYNTEVKRVSDKNRNPSNAANETELAVLEDFNRMLEKGEPLSPKISIDAEGRKHFYAPIFTGGLCLSCHGNSKSIQPEVLTVIDSLYPTDLARDYSIEELRGLWSIKFKNS